MNNAQAKLRVKPRDDAGLEEARSTAVAGLRRRAYAAVPGTPPGRAATALALARQIGLVGTAGARVIAGDRLQRMSATQLQLMLDAPRSFVLPAGRH